MKIRGVLRLGEVEIIEMKGEYLMGIALMRSICTRAIFAFDNNEIVFDLGVKVCPSKRT